MLGFVGSVAAPNDYNGPPPLDMNAELVDGAWVNRSEGVQSA